MFQVFVTSTTTSQSMTVMCSSATPSTMTVMMTPTSMGLTALGQHDVVLPPQLILRDTMRVSVDLATMPQQQLPQSQILSYAYVSYAMDPSEMSFLFKS